jgi:ureidoacrylate peracid hydrolase
MAHNLPVSDDALATGALFNGFDTLDPKRTALLVVDMQHGFVTPGYPAAVPNAAATIPTINRLARTLRRHGGLVIFVQQTSPSEGPGVPPPWQI